MDASQLPSMDDKIRHGIGAALGRIPQGVFILTARHEDRRTGMLASWVQQVSFNPPMVGVAVAKGRAILPLISDSRRFGLCQLPKGEKMIMRKFAAGIPPDEDPFLGLELLPASPNGVPILAGAVAYLECEVMRHVDAEGDHDLFIGVAKAGGCSPGEPLIRLREDGFNY